jgi:hypothetical protein
LGSTVVAQTSVTGQWTPVINWPVEAVHASLLPTGKVLMWQTWAESTGLWDPTTQLFSTADLPNYNIFCSGHAWLADGRLLVVGGHIANYVGEPKANVYNPFTNTWADNVPNMPKVPSSPPPPAGTANRDGRWYPSATTLGNGDVLVMSGDMENDYSNPMPQVYQAATNTWRNLTTAYKEQPTYPRSFVAPDGKVVYATDWSGKTFFLNTAGTGQWSSYTAQMAIDERQDYGSAVMYDVGKIAFFGGANSPTATIEVIDVNVPNPQWTMAAQAMAQPRRQHNTTILADGTVLITGGTTGSNGFNDAAGKIRRVELWNPETQQITELAQASAVYRGYHSIALLLPDGRVLSAGGDHDSMSNMNAEIFSPPYLFQGSRPRVTAAADTAYLGSSFFVATPDVSSIAEVTLIVPGSVTHAQNWTQRIVRPTFTPVEGGLAVTLPTNPSVLIPGYHMMFLINDHGVPSIAEFVQVKPAISLPGDFNRDGTVNTADYLVARKMPGYTAADFLDWHRNFGRSGSFGEAAPEPTSLVYVLLFAGIPRRRPAA